MIALELTTFERLTLGNWVAQQKGDLRQIRQWIQVLDVLELSEAEKNAVGYVQHPNGQAVWKETERTFEIALEYALFALLQPALKAPWPANRLILAMLDKIEAARGSSS